MAISTARSSSPLASAFRACLHGKKRALTMRVLDAVGRGSFGEQGRERLGFHALASRRITSL
jgi:hypothetical protein